MSTKVDLPELNAENTPLVSVIVPVYNTEKQLALCLDSLVFQTLSEIEILVVNDGSTDNSQAIIDAYAEKFPGKVIPLIKENGGPSAARKYGFERARASYVIFIDSDDYVDYHTCERMYNTAIQEDSDAVICAEYRFDEKNNQYTPFAQLKPGYTYETLLATCAATLSGRLLRADFIKEHAIFENMTYEDAAATVAVFSYTKKISYISAPCYAYVINRAGSITFDNKKMSILDTVRANDVLWERGNPKYRPQLAARLMNRIANESFKNEVIYDHLSACAKQFAYRLYPHEEAIKKYCSETNRKRYNQLCLEPEEMVPATFYLNGFDRRISREKYTQRVGMAYLGEQSIVWLDERSCDMKSAPKCIRDHWKQGHADYVGTWFALKKINEQGGVYIGPDIRVNGTFNRMRFQNAFFGFQDRITINTQVFGGKAGQEVWQVLAGLLEKGKAPTIQDAFGWGLCGWGSIHLNGKEQTGQQGIKVFKSRVFSCLSEAFSKDNIASYIPVQETPEAYYDAAQHAYDELISDLMTYYDAEIRKLRGQVKAAGTKGGKNVAVSDAAAARKIVDLETTIKNMQNTLSWRITRPLRFCRTLIRKVTQK